MQKKVTIHQFYKMNQKSTKLPSNSPREKDVDKPSKPY